MRLSRRSGSWPMRQRSVTEARAVSGHHAEAGTGRRSRACRCGRRRKSSCSSGRRDLKEAQLAVDKAKIALGVLIFPRSARISRSRTISDQAMCCRPWPKRRRGGSTSPDLKAANATSQQAGYDVSMARYGYLPSLATRFVLRASTPTMSGSFDRCAGHGRSTLPNFEVHPQ